MTISIHIEPETGTAIASCLGVLRLGDAREGAAMLWETRGWSGRSVVWDCREADFDLSSAEVRDVAEFVSGGQPAVPPERVAFVTPRDVNFGLARMFQVFREDPRTELRVFRDFDEAVAWATSLDADGD